MASIEARLRGFPRGADLGAVGVSAGAKSDSAVVSSFQLPANASGLPRITGNQFAGSTWSLDTTGLTGTFSYDWRIVGGATQGTSATLDTTGLGGSWIECAVTCDQGVVVSPAKMVYMSHGASHDAMDQDVLDLVPHEQASHIAVQSGLWSSPATWRDGKVPRNGARVLIPHGIAVTYDNAKSYWFHWIRIDGTLEGDLTKSIYCKFNEIIITRGAVFTDGIAGNRRPQAYSSEWVISSKDQSEFSPSSLVLADDPTLVGRGIISQGTRRMWGAHKTPWLRTAPGSAPMVGATSLTLAATPTNWQVGDTIAIGGTGVDSTRMETELRTITAISGAVVSWDAGQPLIYDHDHHNSSVTRTDLQPGVGNLTRNIIIRSEDPNALNYMRGHTMDMHDHCWMDLWDVQHVDLGRTVKRLTPADDGTIMGKQVGSNFAYMGTSGTYPLVSEAMTAISNVKSRYPVHAHVVGFDNPNKATVNGCVVIGTPGWAMTHHASEARFNSNVVYDFDGGGMCAEQGNETGEWVNNIIMGARRKSSGIMKIDEAIGLQGLAGNNFRSGYAFGMKSRAIRVNGNFAMDSSIGFVFYHRTDSASQDVVTPELKMTRSSLDLKDLQGPAMSREMAAKDYPIIHANDNEAAGMARAGFSVTKGSPLQNHAWNVNIKNFKVWSFGFEGVFTEYVIQYLFSDLDAVGRLGASYNAGLYIGTNVAKIAALRPKTEGCTIGIHVENAGANYPDSNYDIDDDPKFMLAGHTSTNDDEPVLDESSPSPTLKVFPTVPTQVEPSHNLPFLLADWNGSGNSGVSSVVTGLLTDSVSSLSALPKFNEPTGMPQNADGGFAGSLALYMAEFGYWQVGGQNHIIFPLYFADQLFGTPIKTWHGVRCTGSVSGPNNGAYTISANAPTVSTASMTVASGGSNSIDILALASDVDGGTLTLDSNYSSPDHGRVSISGGVVTYESDPFGWTGTDAAIFFVNDGQGHSTRVDLTITVT